MRPVVEIGLAVAFNVCVLIGGIVWLRQQMMRVVAEQAARKRSGE